MNPYPPNQEEEIWNNNHDPYSVPSPLTSYKIPSTPELHGRGTGPIDLGVDGFWNNQAYDHQAHIGEHPQPYGFGSQQYPNVHEPNHYQGATYPDVQGATLTPSVYHHGVYGDHFPHVGHPNSHEHPLNYFGRTTASSSWQPGEVQHGQDWQEHHSAGSSHFDDEANQHPHHSSGLNSFPSSPTRADRLSRYGWQLPLNDATVMRLYQIIAPRWAPATSKTVRGNLDRLDTHLEENQDLVAKILSGQSKAIEEAVEISSPNNKKKMTKKKDPATIESLDKLYAWLYTPADEVERLNKLPSWAPASMNPRTAEAMLVILQRAWRKSNYGVKQILRKIGKPTVELWSKTLLHPETIESQTAAAEGLLKSFYETSKSNGLKKGRKWFK